ncbi:sigma-54-dependent Fis family transcriptional regulator [Motiliproteus sp.]|uniref:sigma-54-dependent Fis family transcriptional regulator n=1 Tax=Motiliproteus sp. TaxID=1898955 RepID=UPI003BA90BA0
MSAEFQQSRASAVEAREAVARMGHLPQGMLREEIESSWNRCLDQGLSFEQELDLKVFSERETSELQERNRRLIASSTAEMEALLGHFGERDSMVMLSDANATILKSLGDSSFLDRASRYSLLPGASWGEQRGGTNAIGTVLMNPKPLMISGEEHYFDAISRFSCSAAPIFEPGGAVVGVLDVTSHRGCGGSHNLGLVSMSTRLIENRLFVDQYRDALLLAAHSRPEFVDSLWQGLIALANDGTVLAMNREAAQCLGFDEVPCRSAVNSRCFEGLFGQPLGPVIDQSLKTPRNALMLETSTAKRLFARLIQIPDHRPQGSVAAPLTRQRPRPPSDGTIGLDDITLEDSGFNRACRQASRALQHQIPLLLLGETGSGKEALARALHRDGGRCDKPFVALNCAAIPEGLIESELFGYQDGAFTGARRGGMTGKVQQADGGTLFLDEIGDMPLDLQARLLRVLQERTVTPLGGSKELPVDITVICATHRDLKQMVDEGRFREDLYYRLNGVEVQIPALRQRRNFAGLVARLLQLEAGSGHGLRVDDELLQLLAGYHWPGNVRQLLTVLKTCIAFLEPDEDLITPEHLTEQFRRQLQTEAPVRNSTAATAAASSDNRLALIGQPEQPETEAQTLRSAQIEMIRQAVERNDGNISAAAKSLGITRATLYRRLKGAGINLVSEKRVV